MNMLTILLIKLLLLIAVLKFSKGYFFRLISGPLLLDYLSFLLQICFNTNSRSKNGSLYCVLVMHILPSFMGSSLRPVICPRAYLPYRLHFYYVLNILPSIVDIFTLTFFIKNVVYVSELHGTQK